MGDKCYEYPVDRVNCEGFYYTNNITNCTGGRLSPSPACNLTVETFYSWKMPMTFEITLGPREACAFTIYSYIA